MKILVINSGSSSIKYKLFASVDLSVIATGQVEKIGLADSSRIRVPMESIPLR